MKKITLSLVLIASCLQASQKGMLIEFMKETNDSLPLPSAESLAATATLIGGTAIGGITAFQKASLKPQTRFLSVGVASTILSSPVIWSALGAAAMTFIVYYFIGEEMGVIIETKGTLKALTKQIELWQKELPLLKENQENTSQKIKEALNVLDPITPLVVILAKNSETTGAAQQVAAIQKELAVLKTTVQSLTTAQGNETVKTIEKTSHSLFGFGKKKHMIRPNTCIMIDDQPTTLHSAHEAGISKTILCQNSNLSSIRHQLTAYGIL